MGMTYKGAGVDVEAGYKAVDLIKKHSILTFNENVVSDIGGFGGLYALNLSNTEQPVLVAATDGVGTKLKIAFMSDKHDTIGIDCVAMCVNDIVCQGAKPLFFLDYIATGKLEPYKVASIVKGIAQGCVEAGCALIGGETAEMPDFYKENEYDLAGFAVGLVARHKIIDGSTISENDALIGIESSGAHSNGYSLIRKLLELNPTVINEYDTSLGCTIMEELLKPTKIYVNGILRLINAYPVKGIAHITGGGFIENIPRIIPQGLSAEIHKGSWPIKPIFKLIAEWGAIEDKEMFNTFNMGIGMIIAVESMYEDNIHKMLRQMGLGSHTVGKVVKGTGGVEFVS